MLQKFNYDQDFKLINFRECPELYQVGRGEQGVLLVEPYKSEILPLWRFKTPTIALQSAKAIYALFLSYLKKDDFVGMDMARKFLQMGFTRSRRYANHGSGKKYQSNPQKKQTKAAQKLARTKILPQTDDWKTNEKAQSAEIFYRYYLRASHHKSYLKAKEKHQTLYSSNLN